MKKSVKIFLIILAIFLVAFGIGFWYIWNKTKKIDYVEIPKEEIKIEEKVEESLARYRNIAILGIDTREHTYNSGRSDCIMIASINENTKEIKLVSVYRDTFLEIPEHGLDKVTHAYSYGGPALSINTLNTNLDLNIDEFVTINFDATKDIINAMGGIEMDITDAEASTKYIPGITKGGHYNLTGEQALGYGRIRKIDSDYRRTERMRDVLIKVFDKAKKMNISQLNSIANGLLPEVKTNINVRDALKLLPQIASYKIVESKGWPFETRGVTINGVWYGPPINLEKNVIELHKDLFGEEDYIPTDKVKEISNKIIEKTGVK